MKWFGNLKMAYKLLSFFMLMALFLAGVGNIGYNISQKIAESMQEMYAYRILTMHMLDTCRVQSKELEVISLEIILSPLNKADQNNLLARSTEHIKTINKAIYNCEVAKLDEIEQKWLHELQLETKLYHIELQKALELAKSDQQQAANHYYKNNAIIHRDNADTFLRMLSDHSVEMAAEQNWEANRLATLFTLTIAAISSVAVILALLFGWFLNNLITRPIKAMLVDVEEVASGNFAGLSHQIPVESSDEIGKLAQGFNKMSRKINTYMMELEEKNRQIHIQAYHDFLTKLPNRRMFIERLSVILEKAKF